MLTSDSIPLYFLFTRETCSVAVPPANECYACTSECPYKEAALYHERLQRRMDRLGEGETLQVLSLITVYLRLPLNPLTAIPPPPPAAPF